MVRSPAPQIKLKIVRKNIMTTWGWFFMAILCQATKWFEGQSALPPSDAQSISLHQCVPTFKSSGSTY